MRIVLVTCALAATAACSEPSGQAPGNVAAAATPAPADDAIAYSIEGPGVSGKWRLARDGKGSFDESATDALGGDLHLSAEIDVGPAGFAEIERLVADVPAGEPPHCVDVLESMVAMGWRTLVRESAGRRVESRFDLNCGNYGPGQPLLDRVIAADDRMSRWAEQAPGHRGSLEALYGNQKQ